MSKRKNVEPHDGPLFACGRDGWKLMQALLKPPPPEVLALARADVENAKDDEERESKRAYLRHLLAKLPKPRIVR